MTDQFFGDAFGKGQIPLPRNAAEAAHLERSLTSGAVVPGRAEALQAQASASGAIAAEAGGLLPDLDQTRRFLEVLDPSGIFTFQTFADQAHLKQGGKDPLAKWFHGTLDAHAAELSARNQQGAGVFVMINEGNGRGRRNENVIRVRAHFLDLDGAPLDPVRAAGLPPHMVVQSSPDKWHVYWLVDDGDLQAFTWQQGMLAHKFHGDLAVSDLARVMRLPGFYHRKTDAPFMTRLVEDATR